MSRAISFVVALLFGAVVTILSGCSAGGSPTSPTSTAPQAPKLIVETFMHYGNADPLPLPEGRPQYLCGVPPKSEGVIKAVLFSRPGGTPIQIYLMKFEDISTLYCSPRVDTCPGAIDTVVFTEDVVKTWNVMPGNYCVVLRNRSETKQILNGPIVFEHY